MLRASSTGRPALPTRSAETGPRGDANFVLPVRPEQRVIDLHADFAGSETLAPSRSEVRVDLDAPFISLDLRAPAVVDVKDRSVDVLVSVLVGEVVLLSPAGLEVALRSDDRLLATARADASGRVLFRVAPAELGPPGVRTIRAEYARAGTTVTSPSRRLVVRAGTTMALTRANGASDGITLAGALVSRVGPVPHAPVRIFDGRRVLAAILTSADGTFALPLDSEISSQAGLVVRASFVPSEPWYRGSESAPLRLTAPPPGKVPWTWVALPLVAGLAAALAVISRRRTASERGDVPAEGESEIAIERLEAAPIPTVRLRVIVTDRSTGKPVSGARVRLLSPMEIACVPAENVIECERIGRFVTEVQADGYAPREVSVELRECGEYAIRVALRNWREELFERFRRWVRGRSGVPSTPLPTPRELLAGSSAATSELLEHLESGVYGPVAPAADAIDRAEALVRQTEVQGSVDAPN